ncbi:MAG: hypothetical protein Q4E53_07780, partial [Eubacteriales bacterium]|nr:hypothetical protein [Eubacteriales bacterium]
IQLKNNDFFVSFYGFIIMVVISMVSILFVAPIAKKPETYKKTMKSLDKKQKNILEMTSASAAASLVLGAVPVITLLVFVWIIKAIIGMDFTFSSKKNHSYFRRKHKVGFDGEDVE